MTTDEIRALAQRHVEHMGTHDAALTAGAHAEDGILESPSTGTHQGREEITQNYDGAPRGLTASASLRFPTSDTLCQ